MNGVPMRVDIDPYTEKNVRDLEYFSLITNKKDREDLVLMNKEEINRDTISGLSKIKGVGLKVPEVFFKERGSMSSENEDMIRASLSLNSSLNAYENASYGDFISVSSKEYYAAIENLNATIGGLSDENMDEKFDTGQGFEENQSTTMERIASQDAVMGEGNYLIGFYMEVYGELGSRDYSISIGVSNEFTGTYESLCNDVNGSDISLENKRCFFLRKAPENPSDKDWYIGFGCSMRIAISSISESSIGYGRREELWENTTWDHGNDIVPKIQFIYTDTKRW